MAQFRVRQEGSNDTMLQAMGDIELGKVLSNAPRHLVAFAERTVNLSKEEKGIRRSEMFFLYAAVADFAPARIIESGRARAQSTLVLSWLFPAANIISIESDPASPDVEVAAERLKAQRNVECRFGDSRLLLPELLRGGDVVLIDGPKDFRALKLALSLLHTGKPLAVFVHDLWLGTPARKFLNRHLPSAFLSDAVDWVRSYAELDSDRRQPPAFPGNARIVYGATLGCLPAREENYSVRLVQCALAQGIDRLQSTARKIRGESLADRPADFTVVT